MRPLSLSAAVISISALFIAGCKQETQTTEASADSLKVGKEVSLKEALSKSLTFHVSFDDGPDADFGSGDHGIYSGGFGQKEEPDPKSSPGLGNPPLSVEKGKGRFGGALGFTIKNSHPVFYKLDNNIDYQEKDFNGSISFWLNLDTEDIPSKYCDPVQLTDKYYADDCIWVDITKNDVPSDFRLGVFGDRKVWDLSGGMDVSEQFYLRVAKVSNPPFAKSRWTHVVVTWERLNTTAIARGKLYINGALAAQSGPISEPFKWNITEATLRLGTGNYVGWFDDIALFNKTLTLDEIRFLFGMERGVEELNH